MFTYKTKTELITQFETINPSHYAKTRNFIDGCVSQLSPYITHGCITIPELVDNLLSRYPSYKCDKLLMELVWKEWFQHVQYHL